MHVFGDPCGGIRRVWEQTEAATGRSSGVQLVFHRGLWKCEGLPFPLGCSVLLRARKWDPGAVQDLCFWAH